MAKITYEQHIKRHTMRENTYSETCPFCNQNSTTGNSPNEILKRMMGGN